MYENAAVVYPNLIIGGYPPPVDVLHAAGVTDIVFTAQEWQPPGSAYPGLVIHRVMIRDDGSVPTEDEISDARRAAAAVERALRKGRRVLVTCIEGRNRSALVAGLALQDLLRVSGPDVVAWIKDARPGALTNPHFVSVLNSVSRRAA